MYLSVSMAGRRRNGIKGLDFADYFDFLAVYIFYWMFLESKMPQWPVKLENRGY